MEIRTLEYTNKSLEWTLTKTTFEKLTLLVGASGVGKTQILRSIIELQNVAAGKSIDGLKWKIEFSTLDNTEYVWEGEFESIGSAINIFDNENNNSKIIHELVVKNGDKIIERTLDDIFFLEKKTPKLPLNQSILYLLKEENLVKPAFEEFKKVRYSDNSNSLNEPLLLNLSKKEELAKAVKTAEEIRSLNEDIRTKLYLAYRNQKTEIFDIIKNRYLDIFPQVEDIKIEPVESMQEDLPAFLRQYPFIQIKEKGVSKWVLQNKISSGMFRTLLHLSEMYLCQEGTIFLIDEFENSLGVNCIDEITSDIVSSNRKIQFIITSHHPYIINNIPFSHWKVVTRKSGFVKTHDSSTLNLGKSKHEAFMQLLQLEEFQTGQDQ